MIHGNIVIPFLNIQTTYASEPKQSVWDFSLSLSDLLELRLALNFPSPACYL